MENPLRRPGGALPPRASPRGPPRGNPSFFVDAEHQRGHRHESGYREERGSVSKAIKGHIVAMSGEFVGTTMFLFFAFGGTQIANTLTSPDEPDLSQLLYISLSFGFSLAVTAWVFYRISGGLFNPAVRFHRSYPYLSDFADI